MREQNFFRGAGVLAAFLFAVVVNVRGDVSQVSELTQRTLSIEEFVSLALANDAVFEEILIDELKLQYEKGLRMPARDLVASVKMQHNAYLSVDRNEPDAEISLSKLFPYTGTEVSAGYDNTTRFSSSDSASEFTAQISQPIGQNAFGRSNRLLDKIIGLEVDVARHQVVEAYEDYLASTLVVYYNWYQAFENLSIAKSSYAENLKLLDSMQERQKQHIARAVDVNKISLQVLAKKEQLVEAQQEYDDAENLIIKAIRYKGNDALVPKDPVLFSDISVSFEKDYAVFQDSSRTWKVLDLLERKSGLQVEREANDLIPSINLLFGYTVQGEDAEIKNEEELIFAGISMEWPFPDQVDRAEHEVALINEKRQGLVTDNTRYRLYTLIKNLTHQIRREEELVRIASEKIELARSIVKDEAENYSFGKITLNDYISAVNVLDNNRFTKVSHDMQLRRLLVEWLRITDQLVTPVTMWPAQIK
ncbi:MAG TPA: TolC family protein [Candidatus Omnitrophota bacterium]|nr:TolC family protein [Candidatus Omnitrophota bacterium]